MNKPTVSVAHVGVGLIVLAILVYAGTQYSRQGVIGTEAGTGKTITVAVDATNPLQHLSIGGSHDVLHKVWKITTDATTSAALSGLNLTIKGSPQPWFGITSAKLRMGGSQVIATAVPTKVGAKYILPFSFANRPVLFPEGSTKPIQIYLDYTPVDGTVVKNDLKYDVVIESTSDLLFVSGTQSAPTVLFGDGVSTPSFSYLFKSFPKFSLSSISPSGSLLVGDLTSVAVFNATADTAADVGFSTASTGIRVTLDSIINDVNNLTTDRVQVFRKSTGVMVGQTTINFAQGANSRKVWIPIKNFPIAAGNTEALEVKVDTDDFEDSGDSIRAWLDDALPSNVLWSVEGFGFYGHADILWRGDIFAHTLVKS